MQPFKKVKIFTRGKDQYGRLIGEVILPDGSNLNETILKVGLAWWYKRYAPADNRLRTLELSARQKKLGLWSHPSPTPPWEWRKGVSKDKKGPIYGNKRSLIYHLPQCRDYQKISPNNRAIFRNEELTKVAGFREAKNCN
jgi:micrococcal nuclease